MLSSCDYFFKTICITANKSVTSIVSGKLFIFGENLCTGALISEESNYPLLFSVAFRLMFCRFTCVPQHLQIVSLYAELDRKGDTAVFDGCPLKLLISANKGTDGSSK